MSIYDGPISMSPLFANLGLDIVLIFLAPTKCKVPCVVTKAKLREGCDMEVPMIAPH